MMQLEKPIYTVRDKPKVIYRGKWFQSFNIVSTNIVQASIMIPILTGDLITIAMKRGIILKGWLPHWNGSATLALLINGSIPSPNTSMELDIVSNLLARELFEFQLTEQLVNKQSDIRVSTTNNTGTLIGAYIWGEVMEY